MQVGHLIECNIRNIFLKKSYTTQELDDTTLKAEAIYLSNFTQPNDRFVLSLYYNGNNSFLFVNATKICRFKPKDFVIKYYTQCLGNIPKDFTINNMKKQD